MFHTKERKKLDENAIMNYIKIMNSLETLPKWTFKHVRAFLTCITALTTNQAINEMQMVVDLNSRALHSNTEKYNIEEFSSSEKKQIFEMRKMFYQGLFLANDYQNFNLHMQDLYKENNMLYKQTYIPIDEYKHEKIRIGYLSSDLNSHAVGKFMKAQLEHFNKEKFEVYVFYNRDKHDDTSTNWKKLLGGKWHDIYEMKDYEVNQLIRKEEIDILFDLNGATPGNRFNVLQYRPAKKIVNYLGFPNTCGTKFHTHRIVDNITDPSDNFYYSEKLIRMDKCFLCFNCNDEIPEIKYRGTNGVNIVISNKFEKYNNNGYYSLLRKILEKHNDVNFYFRMEHARNKYYVREQLGNNAKFLVETHDTYDYYDRFNLMDIHLDTTPYSGTTTTCSSLIMGLVPFTIYKNNSPHASNVSTSIIRNTSEDLKEFICKDEEDFVSKVCVEIERIKMEKGKDDFEELETLKRKEIREKFFRANNPVEFMNDFEKCLVKIYHDKEKSN